MHGQDNEFDNLLLPNSSSQTRTYLVSLEIYGNQFNNNISELNFQIFSGLTNLKLANDSELYGRINWLFLPSGITDITIDNLPNIEGIMNNSDMIEALTGGYFNLTQRFILQRMNFQDYSLDELLPLLPVSGSSTTVIVISDCNIGGLLSYVNITDSVLNLDLSGNRLYGDVFCNTRFSHLAKIDLSYNQLNGTVEWKSFAVMSGGRVGIILSNNQLTGTVS